MEERVSIIYALVIMVFAREVSSSVANDDYGSFVAKNDLVQSDKAVSRAIKWLLGKRQEDSSWGAFTPRAVVALALADGVAPLSSAEKDIVTKQLNILLSLELRSEESSKKLTMSRLAIFINALYATCQNPRSFHGIDLVRLLRNQTDQALRRTDPFSFPIVFLPLCFAQVTTHSDLSVLIRLYDQSRNKTDLQAIDLMVMSCITSLDKFASSRNAFVNRLEEFTKNYHSRLSPKADVYTKALAMQAMSSGDVQVDVKPLLANQLSDGSFDGSLLATYHAIPALLGKSLLYINKRQCGDKLIGRYSSPLFTNGFVPKIEFSLWIGEDVEKDTHTVSIPAARNMTLFDVMRQAQEKNPIFRFSYDETPVGKRVYSIAGIPNDVEREVYWTLFLFNSLSRRPYREIVTGVDKFSPQPEDRVVFWFKRKSRQ